MKAAKCETVRTLQYIRDTTAVMDFEKHTIMLSIRPKQDLKMFSCGNLNLNKLPVEVCSKSVQ